MSEEKLQQKYMEYNVLGQQLEQTQQQLMALQNMINDMLSAKQTLDVIKNETGEPEIFVPLGGNSFVKATVKDTTKVLTGVGAGVVIEKEIPDAIKTVEGQISELSETQKKLQESLVEMNKRLGELEPEMQKLLQKSQRKK